MRYNKQMPTLEIILSGTRAIEFGCDQSLQNGDANWIENDLRSFEFWRLWKVSCSTCFFCFEFADCIPIRQALWKFIRFSSHNNFLQAVACLALNLGIFHKALKAWTVLKQRQTSPTSLWKLLKATKPIALVEGLKVFQRFDKTQKEASDSAWKAYVLCLC